MILFLFSIFNMKKLFSIVSPVTFHLAPRSLPWDATLNELVLRLVRMLAFVIFLYERSSLGNSTVRRTCLARTGELSWRRVFNENGPPKNQRNSIIGKMSVYLKTKIYMQRFHAILHK